MVLGLANSSSRGSWHVHRRSGGADSSTSATSGVRLAVVIFCWLLLRCVGDDTDGSGVVVTSGMSMDGRFTGWRRPHGGVRGPDAPAVQSGQMVKSHQRLQWRLGPWALGTWLQRGAQASVAIMHGSCMLSAFCACSTLPRMRNTSWNTSNGRNRGRDQILCSVFCVLCFRLNRSFPGSR